MSDCMNPGCMHNPMTIPSRIDPPELCGDCEWKQLEAERIEAGWKPPTWGTCLYGHPLEQVSTPNGGTYGTCRTCNPKAFRTYAVPGEHDGWKR